MTIYKVNDILYQCIREPDTAETQDFFIIKIVVEKNLYRIKGVKDGLIYDYPKSYLDVFMRKYPTHS